MGRSLMPASTTESENPSPEKARPWEARTATPASDERTSVTDPDLLRDLTAAPDTKLHHAAALAVCVAIASIKAGERQS